MSVVCLRKVHQGELQLANVRTILHLTPEAVGAIERNMPSPNKRGAWASTAIVEYDKALHQSKEDAADGGVLERLEARIGRLERLIEQLLQRGAE